MRLITGYTLKQIKDWYRDAAKIVKVCGGYAVFATMDEYQTWSK